MVQRIFYALITNSTGQQVLLFPGEAGWKLPQWEADQAFHPQEIGEWTLKQVRDLTGLDTLILMTYYLKRFFDEEKKFVGVTRIITLEIRNPAAKLPAGTKWVTLNDLPEISFENALCREQTETWLTENTKRTYPPKRIAWGKPGWYAETEKWLHEVGQTQGWQIVGQPEQLKANCVSSIYRLQTTRGKLYLKATPHYFADEVKFTLALTEILPGKMPELVATDSERGLLLSADFGGEPVDLSKDLAVWKEAVAEYAKLQIAAIPQVEKLLATGVRDRRLAILPDQIEKLLARREFMRVDLPFGMNAENADKIQKLAPQIRELCAELATYGVPETVDSGDFHARNVNQTPAGYIFYDWSDLEISHPFFSLFTFFEYAWDLKEVYPDCEAQLREAYLVPWREFLPTADLTKAFELATLLAPLVQNLNYEWIYEGLEPREYWEFEMTFADFYQKFLSLLEVRETA